MLFIHVLQVTSMIVCPMYTCACITAEVDGHGSSDTAHYTAVTLHPGVCGGTRSHLHYTGGPDPGTGRGAQLQVGMVCNQ